MKLQKYEYFSVLQFFSYSCHGDAHPLGVCADEGEPNVGGFGCLRASFFGGREPWIFPIARCRLLSL